jgi:hypothetical protein
MLFLLATGLLVAGCAGTHSTPTTFQSRANAICARMNTSPFLDTQARYDADIRKTKAGLDALARLTPPTLDRRAYQRLLADKRRIYAFDSTHKDSEIALAREGARQSRRVLKGLKVSPWPAAEKRFMALISRETGRDSSNAFTEAKRLGLTACNDESTVGTVRLR